MSHTKEQWAEKIISQDLEMREGSRDTKITCDCGRKLLIDKLYQCFYCGIYFCEWCGPNHFGMTVKKYHETKHDKEEHF